MRRLGKLPARPGAVSFKFSQFFNAAKLPTPPKSFGHYGAGDGLPWGMLGNDQFGDCVWAGAAHETMIWLHAARKSVMFTTTNVLADYSAATGFKAEDPNSDQGTDMTAAADYRRKTGIIDKDGNRHVIDSYLALKPGDVDQLAQAVYVLGAVAVGLKYPDSADVQFDKQVPWTVVDGAGEEGGHYVPCVGRNSKGDFLVVTWGRVHAMSPEFYQKYCDEVLAYVSLDMLRDNDHLSSEGFDADGLRVALKQLTQSKSTRSVKMAEKVEGTHVDPEEIAAAKAAIIELADKTPGMMLYRHLLSDAILQQVATAAVVAAENYRNAPSI